MRLRALFAVAVGALFLAIAIPATAKPPITEAQISGPGLGGGGLRISGRSAASGMWASGIDLFGQLDDAMADSIAELGLTAARLGPRYVVVYRFAAGPKPPEIVRQELYPYAMGGPVTYTPPGHRLFGGLIVTTGWYLSSTQFLDYLVDQGLPETNPVGAPHRESAPGSAAAARSALWIAAAVAGLVALSVTAQWLRRRVVPVARHTASRVRVHSGDISEPSRSRAICRPNGGRCSGMETALDIFRLMMRGEIAPELRQMGFKGSGQSFTLPSETHWVLLGFQKSMASNAKAVRFTVNETAASKRAWLEARSVRSYLPERPSANISYGAFAWQRRIGRLLPDTQDKWWTVAPRASTERVKVEVLDATRIYALPAIEEQLTPEPGEG
jgi:hypothetical protein